MDFDKDANGGEDVDISALSPEEAARIAGQLVPSGEAAPENLVVLPLTTRPIYPSMMVPGYQSYQLLTQSTGMSGNRITLDVLYSLVDRGGRYGLATICGNGGHGGAIIVERDMS